MKENVQIFRLISAILFASICNLAEFCKCLAEHTVPNLVTLLGLAYRIGVVE